MLDVITLKSLVRFLALTNVHKYLYFLAVPKTNCSHSIFI